MTAATTTVVPSRFAAEVSRHLALSFSEIADHPLILGFFGPPGEGKTYQVREVLTSRRVEATSINAADLESDRAGRPGKLLLENYVVAARKIERGRPSALVINDIDTTVGEWEKNTGTVNHQQLLAQLMHLADNPTHIEGIGHLRRVPVIVTGNDLSKLYPPLRRPGRMRGVHWAPTPDEKRTIIHATFSGIADAKAIDQLARKYQKLPVAFFTQLRIDVLAELAQSVIHRMDNFEAVVRDPRKYAAYIMAATSGQSVSLLPIAQKAIRDGRTARRPYLEP